MNLVKVKLKDLNPDPKNTRKHDKRNIETIKKSLKKFGQYRPFVVQKAGMIIRIGNGMYQAMLELGMTEGEVEIKDLTDSEATALSILDNRSSELATWDEKLLAELYNELPDDLGGITGFSMDEIDKFIGVAIDIGEPEKDDKKDRAEIRTCPKCGFRFGEIK